MTLMECVLAIAVMAMALPAVMLVVSHSQASAADVRMEGEARRAILQHANGLAREGFEADAEGVIWAHAETGECLGRITELQYETGLTRHRETAVRYLVAATLIEGETSDSRSLCLSLEYPAAAPRARRKRIEAHTVTRP